MSLLEHAKAELAIINTDGDEMQNMMDKNILEIVEKFGEQGHSGFSAPYAISILMRLLNWKPITPLTGTDDEWNDISEMMGRECYQNKRDGSILKDSDGRAYWLEGKVFSDDVGESWYTNSDSRVYIDFPYFVPDKPERIILN